MRRILGRYVFKVHPDRSLSEMIPRLAEIEAMEDVQVTFDQAADLDLEREGLEDTIDRLLASNADYTRR